jgi:hypothetical protein
MCGSWPSNLSYVKRAPGFALSGSASWKAEGRPVAQVSGVLAERVVISTPLDLFLSLQALATYSGLSRRKLRDHLTDPAHPLPCYRIGGKIVVRRSEYDTWATRYRQVGHVDVDHIVSDVLETI